MRDGLQDGESLPQQKQYSLHAEVYDAEVHDVQEQENQEDLHSYVHSVVKHGVVGPTCLAARVREGHVLGCRPAQELLQLCPAMTFGIKFQQLLRGHCAPDLVLVCQVGFFADHLVVAPRQAIVPVAAEDAQQPLEEVRDDRCLLRRHHHVAVPVHARDVAGKVVVEEEPGAEAPGRGHLGDEPCPAGVLAALHGIEAQDGAKKGGVVPPGHDEFCVGACLDRVGERVRRGLQRDGLDLATRNSTPELLMVLNIPHQAVRVNVFFLDMEGLVTHVARGQREARGGGLAHAGQHHLQR
mmetsp:Transcript_4881/g.10007  ORF Transcript_4881/g.10007 Transcript_4881/m.10007 type:complete len:297 (-) Transcript_4881:128-1018(-)